jgi:DNA invertase Pin-like site-specific DNA recombinase
MKLITFEGKQYFCVEILFGILLLPDGNKDLDQIEKAIKNLRDYQPMNGSRKHRPRAWFFEDASLHRFDAALISKLDRAYRSIDLAHSFLYILTGDLLGFRSLMETPVDITTPNCMMLFNVLASFAQFEKELKRECLVNYYWETYNKVNQKD